MTSRRPSEPRGPKGVAPSPPPWLGEICQPIETMPAGTVFHRIHRTPFDLVFSDPGGASPPAYRFTVEAVGLAPLRRPEPRCALAETLLRNPQQADGRHRRDCRSRGGRVDLSLSAPGREVYGAGLRTVGTDNAISTCPYEPCGLWSDALLHHSDRPDGSSITPGPFRPNSASPSSSVPIWSSRSRSTRPLIMMSKEVAALL